MACSGSSSSFLLITVIAHYSSPSDDGDNQAWLRLMDASVGHVYTRRSDQCPMGWRFLNLFASPLWTSLMAQPCQLEANQKWFMLVIQWTKLVSSTVLSITYQHQIHGGHTIEAVGKDIFSHSPICQENGHTLTHGQSHRQMHTWARLPRVSTVRAFLPSTHLDHCLLQPCSKQKRRPLCLLCFNATVP